MNGATRHLRAAFTAPLLFASACSRSSERTSDHRVSSIDALHASASSSPSRQAAEREAYESHARRAIDAIDRDLASLSAGFARADQATETTGRDEMHELEELRGVAMRDFDRLASVDDASWPEAKRDTERDLRSLQRALARARAKIAPPAAR